MLLSGVLLYIGLLSVAFCQLVLNYSLCDPQYYSDAYILSAECSPSSINVAISFNRSTESDPDDYDLYSLAINCSGNITLHPNGTQIPTPFSIGDQTLPSNTELALELTISASENLYCSFRSCVRYTEYNSDSCRQCLKDIHCSVTVSTSSLEAIYSTVLVTPEVTSNRFFTEAVMIFSSTSSHMSSTYTSLSASANTSTPSSANSSTSSSTTLFIGPSNDDSINIPLYFIFTLVGTLFFMVVIGISICLILKIKRKSTSTIFEYNRKTSFSNDDINIRFQKFDKLSITESLVTIVQSLEFTLPSNDQVVIHESMTTISDHMQQSDNEYTRFLESERIPSVCVQADGSKITELTINDDNNRDSVITDPCPTTILNIVEKENLVKENDSLSYASTSSCGYIISSNTETLENAYCTTDTPRPLYVQAREYVKESFGSVSSSESYVNNNVQFSEYTGPLSEGYAIEQERIDFKIPRTSDNHNENYDVVSVNYDNEYLSEGVDIRNARINNYVFQKKIDNRLLFPSSSSSGYYSGHTHSMCDSYLEESDLGYIDSSETSYMYGSSHLDYNDLKGADGYVHHGLAV